MKRSPEDRRRFAFIHDVAACIVTGRPTVEVAHVRFPDARFGKLDAGLGAKPSFVWTLPLSADLHERQHRMGERAFWRSSGFDPDDVALSPLAACLILSGYEASQDVEGARRWMSARRALADRVARGASR